MGVAEEADDTVNGSLIKAGWVVGQGFGGALIVRCSLQANAIPLAQYHILSFGNAIPCEEWAIANCSFAVWCKALL